MRTISDLNVLARTTERFCHVLEKHCKYIVVSGFVAIATGRTRGTEDVDVIIERISAQKFKDLHVALENAHFECVQGQDPESLYGLYLASKLSIRYILKDHILPEFELKMAKDLLDESQLENRVKIPLTGLELWFSSIETNIAFKEELLKSEKDLEDARHLRTVFAGELDEQKIGALKQLIRRFRLNGQK